MVWIKFFVLLNMFCSVAHSYSKLIRIDSFAKFPMIGRPLSVVPSNRIGSILITQQQRKFKMDLEAMETVVATILKATKCSHMDIGIVLCGDKYIQQLNCRSRKIRRPTDILSFPFHSNAIALDGDFVGGPDFIKYEEEMELGDIYISVPYVSRVMESDRKQALQIGEEQWMRQSYETKGVSGEMMKYKNYLTTPAQCNNVGDGDKIDQDKGDKTDLRGTCLKTHSLLQTRLHLLLVHGILHLMGHDHEESYPGTSKERADAMYDLMIKEEERIIEELYKTKLIP